MKLSVFLGLGFGVACAVLFAALGGSVLSSSLILIGSGLVGVFISISLGAAAQAVKDASIEHEESA